MRVVFVDDEPNILLGMRRAMHDMRDAWQMQFLPSAAAALERLADSPADVIVSDMRMPGMDGWELLTEVRKRHPETVRFVLSGHAEQGAIMRSIGVAHQYLAKPCDSVALKVAIKRAGMLKHLLSNDALIELVGQAGMLPSCPRSFQEVSSCLQQPNSTVADVARIIGRDPGMTANLMKLVNSAFFGSRQSIIAIDRAIAYLGLDTLGTLVLGHGVFHTGGSSARADGQLQALWQHSVATAAIARTIALHEKLPRALVEEAFLAGMLHDLGKVVFATRDAATNGAEAGSAQEMTALIEERHAAMGAYLLGLWGFQNQIVEAVGLHHAPNRRITTGLDLTVLIHIADRLAHWRYPKVLEAAELGIEEGLLEGLGLLDHLSQWAAALDELSGSQ